MINTNKCRILVTGDRGYIGSVLVPILLNKGYEVVGLDSGFFNNNILKEYNSNYKKLTKDLRDINKEDLKNIDKIIHLGGLSNDPLGEFSPNLTEEINYNAAIRFAEISKISNISRFVYASSQSMYGVSNTQDELDEDNSVKNPVTAYAVAKWKAEQDLHNMTSSNFVVTSLRPSTVFGVSPRLRCDIVYNNLVACAYTTGKIEILSDGTPWRPVVHIQDVCSAFIAALEAPESIVSGRAFNVGIRNGNYTVRDIAEAAQKAVPGSELIFKNEHTDPRTYRVSFKRILHDLKDYYKPAWNLERGGQELVGFFKEINFNEKHFRGKDTIRLKQLSELKKSGIIDNTFRYK